MTENCHMHSVVVVCVCVWRVWLDLEPRDLTADLRRHGGRISGRGTVTLTRTYLSTRAVF